MLIETDKRLRVVGEAERLEEADDIILLESPDIVIADLPDARAEDILPVFRDTPTPVLVLICERDIDIYKKCLELGISGLVLKDERSEVLFKAIEKIHDGELWFDRTMMGDTIRQLLDESQMLRDNPRPDLVSGLTDREREVIDLVCLGMKTREIADSLFITENTVRHHLTSVFNKLELKGRLELVIYCFKNGLASMPKSNGSANGAGRRVQDLSQSLSA